MSILGRILPSHRGPQHDAQEFCSHKALVPMWDSNEDMGRKDKIARYQCDHCHAILSPDQARERTSVGSL